MGAADGRTYCWFAEGGGSSSLYPACVSHSTKSERASFSRLDQSQTGVSKEGGVREVQQRGRGQRGTATSSRLPSRHQDHQIHAVLLLRCPSPAAPRALDTLGPASSGPRPWPRPRSAPLSLCPVPSAVLGSKPGAAWPRVTAWKGGGGKQGGNGKGGIRRRRRAGAHHTGLHSTLGRSHQNLSP